MAKVYYTNYDWPQIQKHYDDTGCSLSDCVERFSLHSVNVFETAIRRGLFIRRKPGSHTELTKKKLSEFRRSYLIENPDKVPYLLNHHSKGPSYPERYFREVFNNEGMVFDEQFRVGLYSLDFAFVEKGVDVEIHGSQHYCDKRIVESDARRRVFLQELGWDVIEINWSDYQTLGANEKRAFVCDLVSFIKGSPERPVLTRKLSPPSKQSTSSTKVEPTSKPRKKPRKEQCTVCGVQETTTSRCVACAKVAIRKCKMSSEEMLLVLQRHGGNVLAASREIGISGTGLQKRLRNAGLI